MQQTRNWTLSAVIADAERQRRSVEKGGEGTVCARILESQVSDTKRERPDHSTLDLNWCAEHLYMPDWVTSTVLGSIPNGVGTMV